MYYLLYVALDRFYVSCLLDEASGDAQATVRCSDLHLLAPSSFSLQKKEEGGAVVVFEGDKVIDSCPMARVRRVVTGTPLAEAKAVLRGEARFVDYVESRYVAARDAWLEACLLYSSQIQHESPASAWIDLTRHPHPEDIAGLLLSDVWRATDLPIKAAVASSRWGSKLAARWCDPNALDLGILDAPVVKNLGAFLAPLSIKKLTPVPRHYRERLQFLGHGRIGDVQRVPYALLAQQFGRDAALVAEAAHGRLGDPVVPNYPQSALEAVRRFSGGCADSLVVASAVGEIGDELGERLRSLDCLAGETEMVLSLESGVRLRCSRRLPKPSDHLRLSLLHQFSRTQVVEPVEDVRVVVPDLRRVASVQRSLDQRGGEAAPAVREVRAMYGESSLQKASEIELPRRRQVLRAWRDATGWR